MRSFLDSYEDKEWLNDVHLEDYDAFDYELIVLHGNEDAPRKIELYERNHIDSNKDVVFLNSY